MSTIASEYIDNHKNTNYDNDVAILIAGIERCKSGASIHTRNSIKFYLRYFLDVKNYVLLDVIISQTKIALTSNDWQGIKAVVSNFW